MSFCIEFFTLWQANFFILHALLIVQLTYLIVSVIYPFCMSLWCSELVQLNIYLLFLCFSPYFSRNWALFGGSFEGFYRLSFCFLLVSTPLPPVSVVSPLKPEVFAAKLSQHPDQHLVAFVLDSPWGGLLGLFPPLLSLICMLAALESFLKRVNPASGGS